jgi:hypothetical protein
MRPLWGSIPKNVSEGTAEILNVWLAKFIRYFVLFLNNFVVVVLNHMIIDIWFYKLLRVVHTLSFTNLLIFLAFLFEFFLTHTL